MLNNRIINRIINQKINNKRVNKSLNKISNWKKQSSWMMIKIFKTQINKITNNQIINKMMVKMKAKMNHNKMELKNNKVIIKQKINKRKVKLSQVLMLSMRIIIITNSRIMNNNRMVKKRIKIQNNLVLYRNKQKIKIIILNRIMLQKFFMFQKKVDSSKINQVQIQLPTKDLENLIVNFQMIRK